MGLGSSREVPPPPTPPPTVSNDILKSFLEQQKSMMEELLKKVADPNAEVVDLPGTTTIKLPPPQANAQKDFILVRSTDLDKNGGPGQWKNFTLFERNEKVSVPFHDRVQDLEGTENPEVMVGSSGRGGTERKSI